MFQYKLNRSYYLLYLSTQPMPIGHDKKTQNQNFLGPPKTDKCLALEIKLIPNLTKKF